MRLMLIPLLCFGCQVIKDGPALRERDERIQKLERQIKEEKDRRREKILLLLDWFDA